MAINDMLFFEEGFILKFDQETTHVPSDQFLDYQLLNNHDIPDSGWQDTCTMKDDKNQYYRVNILLGYISEIKDCNEKHRYGILFKLGKLVLVLPNSNASEEKVISMVRINKTTFRASLVFNTLGSILRVKSSNPNATNFKPD